MSDQHGPTAGPDQMALAGKVAADMFGDHAVEMRIDNAIWGHRSWVTFEILVDGGRRLLLVDPWCNYTLMEDGETLVEARSRVEAETAAAFVRIDARLAGDETS